MWVGDTGKFSFVKRGRLEADMNGLDFTSSKGFELDFASLELRTRLRVIQGFRLHVDPSMLSQDILVSFCLPRLSFHSVDTYIELGS